jgi:hypothetical protein
LGGSAPCLQSIELNGIPFLELPTLLLSARDLVTLELTRIPPTGYISSEAMVTGLAALSKLNSLTIKFKQPTPRLERKHLRPLTQTVLPLTYFWFEGASEYLEDLVARIDCPRLNRGMLWSCGQRFDFQVSQLFKSINRSEDPRLTQFGWGDVKFRTTEGPGISNVPHYGITNFGGIVARFTHC